MDSAGKEVELMGQEEQWDRVEVFDSTVAKQLGMCKGGTNLQTLLAYLHGNLGKRFVSD